MESINEKELPSAKDAREISIKNRDNLYIKDWHSLKSQITKKIWKRIEDGEFSADILIKRDDLSDPKSIEYIKLKIKEDGYKCAVRDFPGGFVFIVNWG